MDFSTVQCTKAGVGTVDVNGDIIYRCVFEMSCVSCANDDIFVNCNWVATQWQ